MRSIVRRHAQEWLWERLELPLFSGLRRGGQGGKASSVEAPLHGQDRARIGNGLGTGLL